MRRCWGKIAIGIILLFAQPLLAADIKKADVLKITDGDTVLLTVDGDEIKLRLLEIDCFENKPNLRAKWQAETYGLTETEVLYRGEQSASVLKKLWRNNRAFFYVKLKGKDVYRRYLGTLFIIRKDLELDVNRYMLKDGGCLPYRPKPRRWKPKQ